jgi:sterol desaturase/sphingolipid hydroxylase (fatty acid hydroxylase superfamily)
MEYVKQEPLIRFAFFAGILALMALGELLAPRRRLVVKKPLRWASNLGLVALNSMLARVLFPTGAVGIAWTSEEYGWGLFNNMAAPHWLAVGLSVVLLDLAIYLQHVLFHAVPILWRLHMVHHADLDFDVTTGVRFHTIEILLSMVIKLAVVVLLGAPALAVLIFEVALNATAMFNHANLRLPGWLDTTLRLFVVTPDMHRVHHSALAVETNSNFGFNFPWWDFLFGTYRRQPEAGHEGMTIGLSQFRDEFVDRLHWMLALPFLGSLGNYSVNRRQDGAERRDSETPNESNTTVSTHHIKENEQHVCR